MHILKQGLKLLLPHEYISRCRQKRHWASQYLPGKEPLNPKHDIFKYCNVALKVVRNSTHIYDIGRVEVIESTTDGSEVISFEKKGKLSVRVRCSLYTEEDNDVYLVSQDAMLMKWKPPSAIIGDIDVPLSTEGSPAHRLTGSPVSVVVAEIVMQNIEEQALATYKQTVPLWLRYVDDTFTAVHKDEIDIFHGHLNRQNADIQFTREVEENGKIPFLDCLVSRHDNKLQTTIYRKPTHTDRLLDQSSYNPTSHKATTIRTLTRRAQLVCDSTDSLTDESKYLDNVFSKNNYNPDFVKRNVYKNNEPNTTNAKPVTTATIPYIKGTSETIARILQPYNIRVAHKPITTLRQLLTNVKDKDEPNDRQGAVYKIKCCDCQASYIGETGRNLNIRLTEHKRATKNGDVNNHIAEHHLHTNHRIDWDSAECVTYSTDYYKRLTLESWFTNLEQTPLNRCQQLPAAYKRLVNRTDKH